jgi:glycosyltransferase involved in cell wall biosynthesis
MKILVLCYEYPPVGGGGGRVAATVARGLAGRGHEVVCLTGNVREAPGPLAAEEMVEGVRVCRTPAWRKAADTCTLPEMGGFVLGGLVPGFSLLRSFRPEVMHVHFAVPTGALAWPLSVLRGVPYVLTAHLGDVPGGVPEQTAGLFRWVKPFTVPIWRRAAALTAVSSHVAALAKTAYGCSPRVIFNGLPGDPAAALPSPAAKTPRLLFVGRLSTQKNPLLALRALARLREMPWECEIIGDGPLRPEAENFVRENGLDGRVLFSGWLEAAEVARRRSRAGVLLLPSWSEGLPVAAVEALFSGLAIVGNNIPGLHDVVRDGVNGRLLAPDESVWAETLRELLTHPGLLSNYRTASLERARDFRLEPILDAYEEVLGAVARPQLS